MRNTIYANILLAGAASLAPITLLCGCHSEAKQVVKHDQETRQQIQQQKKKSNAYPAHGSDTNRYIP